jgi:uncharacterized membrane protein YphA (DoxX/SURF4 family)/peroxiredoxin
VPSAALLVARVVLAVVFGSAAAAKLADRPGTRDTLADFGVPARLARVTALLLPVAELAVAAAVLFAPSAEAGATGALVLLIVFSAAIAWNLAAGRTPDCHCFGQLHSSPIGALSLARNAVLGTLSAVILWHGPGMGLSSLAARVGALPATGRVGLAGILMLCLVVTIQGWFVFQLLRQQGRLLLRLEVMESTLESEDGLVRRPPAADFNLRSVSGESLSLSELVTEGLPVLLVFASSGCRPCTALYPEIGRWQRDYGGVLTVAVLARGDWAVNQMKAADARVVRVLIDHDGMVARAYRALPTPSGVLVGPDGRLRSAVATGADAIRGLVVRVVDARHRSVLAS